MTAVIPLHLIPRDPEDALIHADIDITDAIDDFEAFVTTSDDTRGLEHLARIMGLHAHKLLGLELMAMQRAEQLQSAS